MSSSARSGGRRPSDRGSIASSSSTYAPKTSGLGGAKADRSTTREARCHATARCAPSAVQGAPRGEDGRERANTDYRLAVRASAQQSRAASSSISPMRTQRAFAGGRVVEYDPIVQSQEAVRGIPACRGKQRAASRSGRLAERRLAPVPLAQPDRAEIPVGAPQSQFRVPVRAGGIDADPQSALRPMEDVRPPGQASRTDLGALRPSCRIQHRLRVGSPGATAAEQNLRRSRKSRSSLGNLAFELVNARVRRQVTPQLLWIERLQRRRLQGCVRSGLRDLGIDSAPLDDSHAVLVHSG